LLVCAAAEWFRHCGLWCNNLRRVVQLIECFAKKV
jgi:hypothetical protein